MKTSHYNKSQSGFTLVEMSIVLVIIGLIVGGVLVGQDLVKGAQIRATVAQLQQYDAAINTFRGKYDQFPGDMPAGKNTAFFGSAVDITANGAAVGLLGNGRLDASANSGAAFVGNAGFEGELVDFWLHLSAANMVGGSFVDGAAAPAADINYPGTRMKKGGIIAVSSGAINYWLIGVGSGTTNADFDMGATTGISPEEAFGIDSKLDDGLANTGIAFHIQEFDDNGLDGTDGDGASTLIGTTAAGNATCWAATPASNADGVDYLLANDTNSCHLITRIQG